jgi:NAD(P)-dependent dehydrogenase (short-subunit alcohol dehydrogenase family)
VVTGAGRGVGRAVVERLVGDGHAVVALDLDVGALDWVRVHPAGSRVVPIIGSAADESVAERAADAAQQAGKFAGWVNNAAVFHNAEIHVAAAGEVLDLIEANPAPALVGSAAAVRRLLITGSPAPGHPGERGRARLHRHRALSGLSRRTGAGRSGTHRRADGPLPPLDRPDRWDELVLGSPPSQEQDRNWPLRHLA